MLGPDMYKIRSVQAGFRLSVNVSQDGTGKKRHEL